MLFDGDGASANLNGIEHIISERRFAQLPAAEHAYRHPHDAGTVSGQRVAPDLSQAAEHALMKSKVHSHGKTGTPGIRATACNPAMRCRWDPRRPHHRSTATARRCRAWSSHATRACASTRSRAAGRAGTSSNSRGPGTAPMRCAHFPAATPIPGAVDAAAPDAPTSGAAPTCGGAAAIAGC